MLNPTLITYYHVMLGKVLTIPDSWFHHLQNKDDRQPRTVVTRLRGNKAASRDTQ